MKYFVMFKLAPLEETTAHFVSLCELGTLRLKIFGAYELATVVARQYLSKEVIGYKVHNL